MTTKIPSRVGKKVLNYSEVLSLLKQGYCVTHLGGTKPSALMILENHYATVRLDTLCKLREEGLITDYGYSELHSKIYLKEN